MIKCKQSTHEVHVNYLPGDEMMKTYGFQDRKWIVEEVEKKIFIKTLSANSLPLILDDNASKRFSQIYFPLIFATEISSYH